MKRFMVLGLVCVLAVAALGLAGCGNTGAAKEQMETADAAYTAVQKDLETLNATLTTVLGGAATGDFSKLTPEVIAGAQATIKKAQEALPKVAEEYKAISDMSGVADYVTYADKMVGTIDEDLGALLQGKSIVEALAPLATAGDTAGIAAWFQQNTALLTDAQEAGSNATKSYEEAQAYKTEKGLAE
ncbi:MAG: hypothetical protein V1748_10705 [Actinomycetota bacterium]